LVRKCKFPVTPLQDRLSETALHRNVAKDAPQPGSDKLPLRRGEGKFGYLVQQHRGAGEFERHFDCWPIRTAAGSLPTETEWEFAARGGSTGARYGAIDAVAWYDANSEDMTHEVGQKAPNAYGLFDMLGNVWEWVEDAYDTSATKTKRILRGGSFYNLSRDLRVSNRLWAAPDTRHRNMGVRCAGN
jgi:hypothetical protein